MALHIQPAQITFDAAGNARSESFDDIYHNPGGADVKA